MLPVLFLYFPFNPVIFENPSSHTPVAVNGNSTNTHLLFSNWNSFDVELRLSPRWVGGNIGSTDATKTCHILNAYICETNDRKVIINTSLDSL
jgi:hypothetical protein